MKSRRYFPYPVIGMENDFPSHSFSAEAQTYTKAEEQYQITIKYSLDEPILLDLLSQGKIALVASASNKSFFRESYLHFSINSFQTIKIPVERIRGGFELELSYKICAVEQILNYKAVNADPIFHDYNFTIERGQIIGLTESEQILLNPTFENFSNNSSFLKIQKGREDQLYTFIRPLREEVYVYLSHENYDLYLKGLGMRSMSLLSMLVLPVLVFLVSFAKACDTPNDYLWIDVLRNACDNEVDFDKDEDLFKIAEVILHNPLFKSMTELNNLLDQSTQDESKL